MSETIALLRLSFACSRTFLLGLVAVAVTVLSTVTMVGALYFGQDGGVLLLGATSLLCAHFGLAAAGLFHFGNQIDMRRSESGCSTWLLRMPVDSWKIALVPIALKTVWVAVCLSICIGIYNRLADLNVSLPYLAPVTAVSAASVWLMVLVWRPFRSGRRRLAALAISSVLLYAICIGAFVDADSRRFDLSPAFVTLAHIAPFVAYTLAVGLAMQTVSLARTNINGIIPEQSKVQIATRSDKVRNYSSGVHALVHHDWLASRDWLLKVYLIGVLPAVIVLPLLPSTAAIVGGILFFACFAVVSITRIGVNMEQPSHIPVYLTCKPIDSATIAWTRLISCAVVSAITFSCIILAFFVAALRPEHRLQWLDWSAATAKEFSTASAVSTGLRWTIASFITVTVAVVGQIVANLWVGMYGRRWISTALGVAGGSLVVAIVCVVAYWFTQQTTWESAQESALTLSKWLPPIFVVLLAMKWIAVISATYVVAEHKRASRFALTQLIVIWLPLVLTVATALAVLAPHPAFTTLHCFAFVVLAIPLARIIVLPACVAANRHR